MIQQIATRNLGECQVFSKSEITSKSLFQCYKKQLPPDSGVQLKTGNSVIKPEEEELVQKCVVPKTTPSHPVPPSC
jgi:hypothetical protein